MDVQYNLSYKDDLSLSLKFKNERGFSILALNGSLDALEKRQYSDDEYQYAAYET